MNEHPYLPTNTENDYSPFGKTLLRDLLPAVLTGLAIAFILFGLETLTGIGFPLAFLFPCFYPLRGIIYFEPLLGFCLQCLIYGIAVGFAKHLGCFKLGFIIVAMTHIASVFLCPYLS
jgi:hypothetical protein